MTGGHQLEGLHVLATSSQTEHIPPEGLESSLAGAPGPCRYTSLLNSQFQPGLPGGPVAWVPLPSSSSLRQGLT